MTEGGEETNKEQAFHREHFEILEIGQGQEEMDDVKDCNDIW